MDETEEKKGDGNSGASDLLWTIIWHNTSVACSSLCLILFIDLVDVQVLDDIFASQMQQLLGNALQAKDMEPPRSVVEVRSILCKDASNQKDSTFYY